MRALFAVLSACSLQLVGAAEPVEIQLRGFQCVGGPNGVRLPKSLPALRNVGELLAEEFVRSEEWEGNPGLPQFDWYGSKGQVTSKKGISAMQLHRMLGVTYKTAWFMSHRIREAMVDESSGLLGGPGTIVEADETYWGSEAGSKADAKKAGARKSGAALKDSNKVVALVERGGKVRTFHVPSVTGSNLKTVLQSQIHPATHVMTDSSPRYNLLKREHGFSAYEQVNHSKGEYVRGAAHTNTVESYFAIMKCGLFGTFHHVAPKHLQRYSDEFSFRYNT